MNRIEVQALEHPPLIITDLDIFSPLFAYNMEPGAIPVGSMITITGEPGTGKTKYAMQLLDNIGKYNDCKTVFNGYEQTPAIIGAYIRSLKAGYIDDFNLGGDKPVLQAGEVHVLDTIDALAAEHWNMDYPPAPMALWLKSCLERNMIIINVHHKTGTGRKESGSAKFNQLTTAVIELKKTLSGTVIANTRRKCRHPGAVNSIELKHTAAGLVVAPSRLDRLLDWTQSFSQSRWRN